MISWVGIDISKSNLVVWVQPQKDGFEVPNTVEGFDVLVARLGQYTVGRVLLEATGGYERKVMAALQQASFSVLRINPRRARAFAVAMGKNAKTDPIDAAVLADFAEALHAAGYAVVRFLPQAAAPLVRLAGAASAVTGAWLLAG